MLACQHGRVRLVRPHNGWSVFFALCILVAWCTPLAGHRSEAATKRNETGHRPLGGQGGAQRRVKGLPKNAAKKARFAMVTAAKGASRQEPFYLNTRPGIGHVGSEVCARCHKSIHDDYIRTAMSRSMTLPTCRNVLSAPVAVRVPKLDRDFEVFCRGGALYQAESQPGPGGSVIFRDTERVAYVIGAGQNGLGFIIRKGNYLFESPLSFYTHIPSWDLSPGYQFADYGFLRSIPAACIICHSGRPRPVIGRPGLFRDPPFHELAIGCENCHGPGQLHVEERLKGKPLRGRIDRSIVNPSDLSGWRADNICMECHQAGDTREPMPGKTYRDYRPGEPLADTVEIFAVPFGPRNLPQSPLLQHYQLMTLSRCYLASGGHLHCITCHDPHFQPTPGQAPAYYRARCLICHTTHSCTLPLARRLSEKDNCINCHMPRQHLELISHSALTNHRIIAYPGEPFPQAAFHQTTPALPDLVWLDAPPGHRPQLPSMVLLRAYGELIGRNLGYRDRYETLLNNLAVSKPNSPLILSALARRNLEKGTRQSADEAKKELTQAIQRGSTLASDFELDAQLLAGSGNLEGAIAVLKRGITVNPYATRLYKRLAIAYIQAKDYQQALRSMKQEVQIYPEDSFMRSLIAKGERAGTGP
jgi:hypothetical protein